MNASAFISSWPSGSSDHLSPRTQIHSILFTVFPLICISQETVCGNFCSFSQSCADSNEPEEAVVTADDGSCLSLTKAMVYHMFDKKNVMLHFMH